MAGFFDIEPQTSNRKPGRVAVFQPKLSNLNLISIVIIIVISICPAQQLRLRTGLRLRRKFPEAVLASERRFPTGRVASLAFLRGILLGAGRRVVRPIILAQMSDSDSQTTICPSCGEEIESAKRRCPRCGRPMGERGFFFYAFWVGLSLMVVGLIACIFYTGFLILNRML